MVSGLPSVSACWITAESVTIYHYSYLGSHPRGRLGRLHPERVAAWDAEFARIAERAVELG